MNDLNNYNLKDQLEKDTKSLINDSIHSFNLGKTLEIDEYDLQGFTNEIKNADSFSKNTLNIPRIFSIISAIISLFAIPFAYFSSVILLSLNKEMSTKDLLYFINQKYPYVIAPIAVSILYGALITAIGVAVFILSFTAVKYIKITYVGLFICSFLYFLLIIPSIGASFIQFVLCLIAAIIEFDKKRLKYQ